MTERQQSKDGDFEVVPQLNRDGDFMSMSTVVATGEDPYENRQDIKETKSLIPSLVEKLNFKDNNDLDEIREKLKSRDALDAGIVVEMENLQDISNSEDVASERLRIAAADAKEHIARARQLACDSKTTVKKALDILEAALPVFLEACKISNETPELSPDFAQLQDLYRKTVKEMLVHQQNFEMEERANKLSESKGLLERSISVAATDRERVGNQLAQENERAQLEQFIETQSDVDLLISSENKHLDAWLISCHSDIEMLEKATEEQRNRHDCAKKKYESRIKVIETQLDVNFKRQTELKNQLEKLQAEQTRLQNNRVLENEAQKRASELNSSVSKELEVRKEKVKDIKDHASTALEIMLSMHQCSSVLFDSAIETQKKKEEALRQLEMEAVTRERSALATAAVEFKLQIHMGEENIKEYTDQLNALRKEIEKAAKKGQKLIVSKKKQESEDFQKEIDTEVERNAENTKKLEEIIERLKIVDEKLRVFGVTITPEIESLFQQRMADMQLETEGAGPMSFLSV